MIFFYERQALRENARKAKMLTSGTIRLSEGFAQHLRDVMESLFKVWNNVTPTAVRNCWRKSTLVDFAMPLNLTTTTTNSLQAEELKNATTTIDAVDSQSLEEHNDATENQAIFSVAANRGYCYNT